MSLTGLSFSDYMEGMILQWFGGMTFDAAPATLYIGLFTTNPADTGTKAAPADGTEVTTVNGAGGWAGYARISLTTGSGWNAIAAATGDSTGQQISNVAAIGGAGTAWVNNNGGTTVTITGIGFWSASTSGHLFAYIPLAVAQAVTAGASFGLAASGMVLQVD
jgi:hypothetical protein